MIKKIISVMVTLGLSISLMSTVTFAKSAKAKASVINTSEITRTGVNIAAKWDNYTVASFDISLDDNATINGTAIKDLSMFKVTCTLSDYFTLQNSNSRTITTTSAKNSKIMLSKLPVADVASVPVISNIKIEYKKNADSDIKTKTISNVNLKLRAIKDYESEIVWNKDNSNKGTVFMSVSNNFTIDGNESIEDYKQIEFICKPSKYFTSSIYKDGSDSVKNFAGLSYDKEGNIVWTYVPYNTSKKYSPAGNGVYFTATKTGNGAFLDGQLPVFDNVTVIGTKADGTTVTKEVKGPSLKMADYTVKPVVKLTKSLVMYYNQFGVRTMNTSDIKFIDFGKNNYADFHLDTNNFGANSYKLLPTYTTDDKNRIHTGDWHVRVNYLDGTVGTVIVPEYIKEPMLKVTVIDGENKTVSKIKPYGTFGIPSAKGIENKTFVKWVYTDNKQDVSEDFIVNSNKSLTAIYKDNQTGEVTKPEEGTPSDDNPDIDIPDEDTPQADAPDTTVSGSNSINTPESIDIVDDDVPSASNPKTGCNTIYPFVIITMLGAVATSAVTLKKKAK